MLLNPLFGLTGEPSSSGGPSLIGDDLSDNPFQEILHSVQQADAAEPNPSGSGYPSLADLIADVVSAETSQNPGLERQASDHPQKGHAKGQLTASEVPIEPGLTNGLTRVTPQHQILSDMQESPLDLEPEVDPEARNPLTQTELPFLEGTTRQVGESERQNNPDSQLSHQTNTFSRLGFPSPDETLVPGRTGTGGDDSEIVPPPRGNGTDGQQILLEESDMAFSPQPEDDAGIANHASLAPAEEMENESLESDRWTVRERPSNEPLPGPRQNSFAFLDTGPGSLDDSPASPGARSHGHDQAALGHSSNPAEDVRGSLGQAAVRSGERESKNQSPSGRPSPNIASWDSGSPESSGLYGRENHQAGTGSQSFQDGLSGFVRAEDDSQRPSSRVGQGSLTPDQDVPFESRVSYGSQSSQGPNGSLESDGSRLKDPTSADSVLGMSREVLLQRERSLDSEIAPTNGDLTTQTEPEARAGIGIESRNTYESPEFAKDVVTILGAQQNLPHESDLVADLLKSMESVAGRPGAERQPQQTGQQTPGIGQGSAETGSPYDAETRHGEQVRTSTQAPSIPVQEAGSEARAPLGIIAASSFERSQRGTDNEDSSAGEGSKTDSKVGDVRNALNRDQAQITFTRDEHQSNLGSEQGPSLQDRARVVSAQYAYLEQPDSDVPLLNLLPSDRQDVQILSNTPSAPDSGFVPSIGATRAGQELISSVDASDQPASQPTLVDEPKVTSQIVRGARFLTREGANQVTLRLDPPELGEVTIRLSSADNSLTGEIRVGSRMVQELVNRNMANLRESLGSQGIQVDNIEVSVESGGRSGVDRDGSAPSQRENADRNGQPTSDRDRQPQKHNESHERPARQAAEDGNVDFIA